MMIISFCNETMAYRKQNLIMSYYVTRHGHLLGLLNKPEITSLKDNLCQGLLIDLLVVQQKILKSQQHIPTLENSLIIEYLNRLKSPIYKS